MTDERGDTYATRGAQMFLRFTDDEMARLAGSVSRAVQGRRHARADR